jgi:hypothetical protein
MQNVEFHYWTIQKYQPAVLSHHYVGMKLALDGTAPQKVKVLITFRLTKGQKILKIP